MIHREPRKKPSSAEYSENVSPMLSPLKFGLSRVTGVWASPFKGSDWSLLLMREGLATRVPSLASELTNHM